MSKVKIKFSPNCPFNLLCAGELEIIKRPDISNEERQARVEILNTICYHAAYLDYF